MATCVKCGITLATPQATAFQGGWRDKPQCRAWKACEARMGHRYDRYLNLISCTREDCPGGPQHPIVSRTGGQERGDGE